MIRFGCSSGRWPRETPACIKSFEVFVRSAGTFPTSFCRADPSAIFGLGVAAFAPEPRSIG